MRVAVIPARGGSRRIPHKNIRMFHGKPIIAYSIEAARAAKKFDRIIVSTDNDEIAAIAQQYEAEVFRRKPDDGTRGTLEVTAEVVLEMTRTIEYACCIYPTAPMISPAEISWALYWLRVTHAEHCVAVGTDPLRDAAQFYWSDYDALMEPTPYWQGLTVGVAIPENRICDINEERDWLRAEQMYAELHK